MTVAAGPWVAASLLAGGALYAIGARRLWLKAGAGRGIAFGQAASFAGGCATLALALLSPIDAAAQRAFWVHMVQHEMLMVVAAPLLVLGRPLEAWTWGLPRSWRGAPRHAGAWQGLRRLGAPLAEPLPAWTLHALALWAWHAPALFERALAHDGWHFAQHASFLATGLVFWWSVLRPAARRAAGVRPGSPTLPRRSRSRPRVSAAVRLRGSEPRSRTGGSPATSSLPSCSGR